MRPDPLATPARGGFFADYPRFFETSVTDTRGRRMEYRHAALIAANRERIAGLRVLDLASHDGRWSFAALQAGATRVTGIEARPELCPGREKTSPPTAPAPIAADS